MKLTTITSKTLTPEQRTAATLSAIVEPSDATAATLINLLGGQEAFLEWIQDRTEVNPQPETYAQLGSLDEYHRRLALKLSTLDLDRELAILHQLGGHLICPTDEAWPRGFDCLGDSQPFALWVRGSMPTEAKVVTITGSRASTSYGNEVAREIAQTMSEYGAVICNGGAYGIDTVVMRTTPPQQSLIVLAGGLSTLYPQGNIAYFDHVVQEGGALITEVPPTYRPARWRFLARNRIIAALSDATVIPEASLRSGAVAIAHKVWSFQETWGRRHSVGAVPGPITAPTSTGTNDLIAKGAAIVRYPQDALDLLQR